MSFVVELESYDHRFIVQIGDQYAELINSTSFRNDRKGDALHLAGNFFYWDTVIKMLIDVEVKELLEEQLANLVDDGMTGFQIFSFIFSRPIGYTPWIQKDHPCCVRDVAVDVTLGDDYLFKQVVKLDDLLRAPYVRDISVAATIQLQSSDESDNDVWEVKINHVHPGKPLPEMESGVVDEDILFFHPLHAGNIPRWFTGRIGKKPQAITPSLVRSGVVKKDQPPADDDPEQFRF